MMRNLIHFVGDVHQPLHSADRYTRQYPSGDRGGNDFPIEYDDDIKELHALWDSVLGYMEESLVRPLSEADRQQV